MKNVVVDDQRSDSADEPVRARHREHGISARAHQVPSGEVEDRSRTLAESEIEQQPLIATIRQLREIEPVVGGDN